MCKMETPEDTRTRPPSEWYCCRKCGQRLFKIIPGARANGIMYKCKRCREIIEIRI